MIDNIIADHFLLSDSRLECWLLRYSQNSGDGSCSGVGDVGRGVDKCKLDRKVQMDYLAQKTTAPRLV